MNTSFRWLTQFTQSPEGKLWDDAALAGDTASPAPVSTGAPAPPAAIPQAAQPQATSGEDRSSWVPPHRLRETREAAQREFQSEMSRRESAYQEQLRQRDAQLQALVGVTPRQPSESDAVRQQFAALFPKLAKLEERGEDVFGLLERSGDLEAQAEHYWQQYGKQTMDRLFNLANTSMGGPLSDEAKRSLHSSFVGFVQSSPEMKARYESDPTIVNDFWKAFTSSFIDPVRRSATATVTGRTMTATPQDTPGGAPRATPAVKPADMDERAAQAWALYQQHAKT